MSNKKANGDDSSIGLSQNHMKELLRILTSDMITSLENIFTQEEYKWGMNKTMFLKEMINIMGEKTTNLSNLLSELFDEIQTNNLLTWSQFLEHMIKTDMKSQVHEYIYMKIDTIYQVPHTKREPIIKILPIYLNPYFYYILISKHGKIGVYNSTLNLLFCYYTIFTRDDIHKKKGDVKMKKNRWITDCIYLKEIQKLFITNTARTLVIYDITGLKHVLLWIIISLPQIPRCLAYKMNTVNSKIDLFVADDVGGILTFHFASEKLFRKKHNDKLTLFYWKELKHEKTYVEIKYQEKVCGDGIRRIIYVPEENAFVCCSRDSINSIVKYFLDNKKEPMIYSVKSGFSTIWYSKKLNLIIGGSSNGVLRILNTLVVTGKSVKLIGHKTSVQGIFLIESTKKLLSVSKDGILKLWDLNNETCLQTVNLHFPCFKEEGKIIEWATNAFFCQPFFIKQSEDICRGDIITDNIKYVWISCCNFLAKVNFVEKENIVVERLSPPPVETSVLIPGVWNLKQEYLNELKNKLQCNIEIRDFKTSSKSSNAITSNVNTQLVCLDQRTQEIVNDIRYGACYLTLKLFDTEELRISDSLFLSNKIKNLANKTKSLLSEAYNKDQIFSEVSSSRSRSSRSSAVEFEY